MAHKDNDADEEMKQTGIVIYIFVYKRKARPGACDSKCKT